MSTLRLLVDLPTPLSPYNTHEYTYAKARTLSLGIAFVDYCMIIIIHYSRGKVLFRKVWIYENQNLLYR